MKRFVHAFRGIVVLLQTQSSARIHALVSSGVIAAALWLRVPGHEWRWLVAAIIWVWTAEALNTAIEFLADLVTRESHPLVKHAKDAAAGGVLVAALGAAAIGLSIFWPHLSRLVR